MFGVTALKYDYGIYKGLETFGCEMNLLVRGFWQTPSNNRPHVFKESKQSHIYYDLSANPLKPVTLDEAQHRSKKMIPL